MKQNVFGNFVGKMLAMLDCLFMPVYVNPCCDETQILLNSYTGLPLGFLPGVAETLPGVAQGAPLARGEPRRGEIWGDLPPNKNFEKMVQFGAFWVVFDEPMRCTKHALKMTE